MRPLVASLDRLKVYRLSCPVLVRIHYGPGYRIYYRQRGDEVVLRRRQELTAARYREGEENGRMSVGVHMVENTTLFDAAKYLDSHEAVVAYLREALNEAIESDDMDFFLEAIGDLARARGMSEIADKIGVNRGGLINLRRLAAILVSALSPGL